MFNLLSNLPSNYNFNPLFNVYNIGQGSCSSFAFADDYIQKHLFGYLTLEVVIDPMNILDPERILQPRRKRSKKLAGTSGSFHDFRQSF